VTRDEDLVERVAQGETGALDVLLRRYERPLNAFLHRRTGGLDVEDLYQETWMRVVRAAPGFDSKRRFSTWLFEIAANLCRDWWRRRPPEAIASETADVADPSRAGSARVDDTMTVEALLAKLPDAQREAVVLRYWHDFSEAELSEILGCPRGTVKSRLHAALARLAELAAAERP
jgi:RNA polymerase sigma-70 factor (ECF subfamily)